MNPEHRGRVRGISGSISCGKGFGEEYAGMYRKKRKISDDSVMSQLVEEATYRVLMSLITVGVKVPDDMFLQQPHSSSEDEPGNSGEGRGLAGEDEEHASEEEEDVLPPQHASEAGEDVLPLQHASEEGDNVLRQQHATEEEEDVIHPHQDAPMVNNNTSPAASEPDTFALLTEPTKCSLMDTNGFRMELATTTVYPKESVCHTVIVDHEYAVVKPTYVHANANHIELPIPVGGDEIRNLGQALLQRIQWPKRHILIPPKSRAPNSAAQSGATGSDAGTAAHHRAKPQGSQPKSKPPKSQHSQPLPKRPDSQEPPKPQRSQPKPKQPTHQPKPKTSNVAIAWTKTNPNYKPGERMLSEEDSKAAGPDCVGLHAYYMEHSAQGKTGIPAQVPRSYFRSDGDLEWTVQFSDLYDLFNNGGLDVCLLRCWTL
ncbi:unnamed protein product [Urochloa humidicola]